MSEAEEVTDTQRRTHILAQITDGTQLSGLYALRTFPVHYGNHLHGSTTMQLSGSWALAEAARLRDDPTGMALVGTRRQRCLRANPLGQSPMYGVEPLPEE